MAFFRFSIEHPPHRRTYLLIRAVGATYPAAGPTLSFLQLRDSSFNVIFSCLWSFYGDIPANPLIAGERSNVFPSFQSFRVREKYPFQVWGHFVHRTAGDFNFSHTAILHQAGPPLATIS
jgi:hypothetical protein